MWTPEPAAPAEPVSAALDPTVRPPNLDEQLAVVCGALSRETDPWRAAARALSCARTIVPCEAGAVFRTVAGDAVEFHVVERGGGAALVGRRLSLDHGIVGACVRSGEPIVVADVAADPRHRRELDAVTGFRTVSVLCVPVRGPGEPVRGALELLNGPGPFVPWHVEAVAALCAALGAAPRPPPG